jgi:lon-related putative ATP-dependent protease
MGKRKLEVPVERLRNYLDPAQLDFESTAEVPPSNGAIGQDRALSSLEFALDIGSAGYNVYVAGDTGTSKNSTVESFLHHLAKDKPVPSDWIYVYNFDDAYQPRSIELPAGLGEQLAADMDRFIEDCKREIPRALEGEHYERRKAEMMKEIDGPREQLSAQLQEMAKQEGFAIQTTPVGVVTVPLGEDGQPISREAFDELPEEKRQEIQERNQKLQQEVAQTMARARRLEKEAGELIKALDKEIADSAVGTLLEELRERYVQHEAVVIHLVKVREDIGQQVELFRPQEKEAVAFPGLGRPSSDDVLERYKVNVLVSHRDANGAPVVIENNPTYYNLIGRIDYRVRFGGMTTDFTMIKPGALHLANGGYLVIQAVDLLTSFQAWDALKRAIRAQSVHIENLGEQYSAVPTATLKPEPIPLNIKIVMVGLPYIYYILHNADEDFRKMFKVRSDFGVQMDRTKAHAHSYASFIASQVASKGLLHFDRTGVAKMVEYGSRLESHQQKLSTRFLNIGDLVAEASYWAGKDNAELVQAAHVQRAIDERTYRSNMIEERLRDLVTEGTLMISTQGHVVGQLNGLSVSAIGDYSFGRPSRITARTAFGQSGVVAIERETKMSGRIHSKGVLILGGYLMGKFAQDKPLALSASITFEQLYDEVEGDSASSTELYAILSGLSDLPLRQDIAVTGSVNQLGEVQPIGGVNEKIEGFFRVCKALGLTGQQGVMIPEANVKHLMLNEEVVEAIKNGDFCVHAVKTIDEGIELLTGRRAGNQLADGTYPPGTVYYLVDEKLRAFSKRYREIVAAPEKSPLPSEGREAA